MKKSFLNNKKYFPAAYSLNDNDLLKDEQRQKKWRKERKKYGFDETEIWSLDNAIGKLLYPRLKKLWKLKIKLNSITDEKTLKDIKDMLQGFKIISKHGTCCLSEEHREKVHRSLKLFTEYIYRMWI